MSEPFRPYQAISFQSRTLFAAEGAPVPFEALAAVGRADERKQVVTDLRTIRFLYARTVLRFIASLIGVSGVAIALNGLSLWYVLTYHPDAFPLAVPIVTACVTVVGTLILRGVIRRSGHDYFISSPAKTAMEAHARERDRLRKRRTAALERLKSLDRLPAQLSKETDRLGRLGGIHLDEVERFRGECEKARVYAEREHHPTREAAARIETLRERLVAESAMLEKAIKLADRLAIAYAKGPGLDVTVATDHADLRGMLTGMEQAFARGGRTFESAVPADADPRYASGKPHD